MCPDSPALFHANHIVNDFLVQIREHAGQGSVTPKSVLSPTVMTEELTRQCLDARLAGFVWPRQPRHLPVEPPPPGRHRRIEEPSAVFCLETAEKIAARLGTADDKGPVDWPNLPDVETREIRVHQ